MKFRLAAMPCICTAAAVALAAAACTPRCSSERVEWVSMGTVAAFQCRNAADLQKAQTVREVFAKVEALLNAHDPDSELRRLAGLGDAEILAACDPLVRPCYEAAFRYRDLSLGVFNPRYRGPGTMDLGGIAKGFAIDLAADAIGPCDALIDLGGNLKALGGSWRVGVHGANGPAPVTLNAGEACSTSGEYFRGKHIKDGRDGSDLSSKQYSVTAVHPESAMAADALSTIFFILGKEHAEAFAAGLPEHGAVKILWL